MKKVIELKLKFFAKLILKKYKPRVIGITGSVGKTSTREAIFAVLSGKYETRQNLKNYNNEIGLPLTIIGAYSPGKSLLGWCLVFLKALWLLVYKDKNYPKLLILEMGVDKPGDMKYLNSIVQCEIGVITAIGTVHIEYFKDRAALREEKAKLIEGLSSEGLAIINNDDPEAKKILKRTKINKLSYGLNEGANIRALNIKFSYEKEGDIDTLQGTSFKLFYKDAAVPVLLKNVLGKGGVYAALAAAAVGVCFDMNLLAISEALSKFKQPVGRMNLLKGNKGTLIIDDTYNAEPKSVMTALGVLKELSLKKESKKFAVLGDMLELGRYSEQSHQDIGKYLAKAGVDVLITVGERARDINRGAKEAGFKAENMFHFADSLAAGKFLESRIKKGDLILVKGSQGIRMEKVVLEIMAEPWRAKDLLVRQEKEWQ